MGDLVDGDKCHVAIRILDYHYASVFKLTSGREFRLPSGVADEISKRAYKNPNAAIEFALSVVPLLETLKSALLAKTREAMAMSSEERKRELRNSHALPQRVEVRTTAFIRNPIVVAEVLIRANGKCELCQCNAPFFRASDGTPYLEVHHVKRLADGGYDTVKNAVALCPNCHRKAHFG